MVGRAPETGRAKALRMKYSRSGAGGPRRAAVLYGIQRDPSPRITPHLTVYSKARMSDPADTTRRGPRAPRATRFTTPPRGQVIGHIHDDVAEREELSSLERFSKEVSVESSRCLTRDEAQASVPRHSFCGGGSGGLEARDDEGCFSPC